MNNLPTPVRLKLRATQKAFLLGLVAIFARLFSARRTQDHVDPPKTVTAQTPGDSRPKPVEMANDSRAPQLEAVEKDKTAGSTAPVAPNAIGASGVDQGATVQVIAQAAAEPPPKAESAAVPVRSELSIASRAAATPATRRLPSPLTPAESDLTGYKYFPMFLATLARTEEWVRCKQRHELAFPVISLMLSSWHSTPAGSLPNSDALLADAAGCDPARWSLVKDEVMQHWLRPCVACASGNAC